MKRGQLGYRQIKEETSSIIKLKDLAKLVSHVQPSFKDLDLLEDDPVIIVADSDEDKDDEVHATKNVETEDTSVPKSSSLSSLPTELKDLSSKFDELTKEVKGLKKLVHELDIELLGDLKEILTKLEDFTKTVTSLTSQVLDSASSKARDESVPSAGQADTRTVEGEKDTNQATISYLFQRRAKKNVEDNLNKNNPQTKTTSPPIPPVITKTKMQSPSHQPSPKGSSHPEGEHIKEDKGKKALSLQDAEKESTDSDSGNETHVTGSMVEPSKTKKLKKFDFITKDGRHIHLTEEEINHQKKLEEDANAKVAKQDREVRKAKLVDLLGPEVVKKKYYNENYDVLTRKGPITLKVYRENDTSEIIPNFKASDLHLGKWREVMKYPLDKLNDLANKKRKLVDDIHDYFNTNKRLKSPVQYKDHLPGTVLNELILASALQVLRRLGSIFTSVYAAVQKLKKDSWKELQFSLVDNSKLNVVYLLNRKRRDGIASIKRRCRDFQGDNVKDFVTASERSCLKVDLEPSTWQWRHGFKATS
ncbi:hypothetical protein Tco_0335537 [Tanacetum coccineum]